MPGSDGYHDRKIVRAVKEGILDEKLVDRAVERNPKVVFDYIDHRNPDAVFDRGESQKAVDIESECAVPLENNGNLAVIV